MSGKQDALLGRLRENDNARIFLDESYFPIPGKPGEIVTTIEGNAYIYDGDTGTYEPLGGGSGGARTPQGFTTATVGEIPAGTDLGTTPVNVDVTLNQVFYATKYPTYTAPTFSLTNNQANGQEIGKPVDLLLTYNFGRGSINGLLVGGIWQPSTFQDFRAGAANKYIIDGTDLDLVNTKTINPYILLATQTFSGNVSYDIGPQPTDSAGQNYQTPLAAGNQTVTSTLTALYPYFYGVSATLPTADQTLINSGTKVVASSTSTLTVPFNPVAEYMWFAIPATSTSKTKWYVNALNNGNIGSPSDLFGAESIVSIDSPSAYWAGVNYKIYIANYVTTQPLSIELRNS